MVFAGDGAVDPVASTIADGAETVDTPGLGTSHHERLTIEKLRARDALPFFEALKREFPEKFPSAEVPRDAAAMVQWFSTREGRDDIQRLLHLVRRALQALAPPSREDPERRAAEGAAVALFCHAATRLVDQAVAKAQARDEKDHIRHVPTSELFVCAVIATAIFGGELHLKTAVPRGVRQPEYVFEVKVPAGGDQETEVFERAAYAAVLQNDRDTPGICLESSPLNPQERALLAARIADIQDQERAIALVVHGLPRPEAARGLADAHRLPVLLPSELATPLLGMTPERLHAEFGELWRLLDPPSGAPP
ncbi:MAG: hypothetical protein ACRENJ_03905 [Candidatus Eiseniibacteriota bacterium]